MLVVDAQTVPAGHAAGSAAQLLWRRCTPALHERGWLPDGLLSRAVCLNVFLVPGNLVSSLASRRVDATVLLLNNVDQLLSGYRVQSVADLSGCAHGQTIFGRLAHYSLFPFCCDQAVSFRPPTCCCTWMDAQNSKMCAAILELEVLHWLKFYHKNCKQHIG